MGSGVRQGSGVRTDRGLGVGEGPWGPGRREWGRGLRHPLTGSRLPVGTTGRKGGGSSTSGRVTDSRSRHHGAYSRGSSRGNLSTSSPPSPTSPSSRSYSSLGPSVDESEGGMGRSGKVSGKRRRKGAWDGTPQTCPSYLTRNLSPTTQDKTEDRRPHRPSTTN